MTKAKASIAPVSPPVRVQTDSTPGRAVANEAESFNGKRLSVKLSDGRAVTLQGFKVDVKNGFSDGQCGVVIERQRVMSMGVDETEVLTCGGLIAAGVVPARKGIPRIGLIYEVTSPNAQFRAAVVLQEVNGAWQVDPKLAGVFDDQPASRSIADLRRALATRGQ